MASFFPDQIQKLLLQYLLFYSAEPETFFNLCLVNKFCANFGREITPAKKKNFTKNVKVFNRNYPVLPNRWIHGFVFDSDPFGVEYHYRDSFLVSKVFLGQFRDVVFVEEPKWHRDYATQLFFINRSSRYKFLVSPLSKPNFHIRTAKCPLCNLDHLLGYLPGYAAEFPIMDSCFGKAYHGIGFNIKSFFLKDRKVLLQKMVKFASLWAADNKRMKKSL